MPQRRFALLRPTRRRRPRRRRGRRDTAPSRRDALPRQQALRGRVILHMHLIQTLDAARRVVPPKTRVGAAPRPAVEARVVVGRAATRVRRFTHQTVRGAPLREVLEDQAAAGSVGPGSRPPLHHLREVELRDGARKTALQLANLLTTSPPTVKPSARPTRAPTTPEPTSTDGALPRHAVELAVAAAAFAAYLLI